MESLPRPFFTAEHHAFRDQVRRFCDNEIAPHHAAWEQAHGVPREIWKKAGDNGLLCCWLPAEDGGPGADLLFDLVVCEELGRIGATGPGFPLHSVIVTPYIAHHGTPSLKQRVLPGMVSGERIGAIVMTEPGTGSDLAGIRTRAERDGDHWVINGQKVWTSLAHKARWGLLLARTDPDVVKQGGITAFLVRMDSPGIEIRPIRQMSGPASFNEVFFDGVRIPDSMRIGDVNDGWKVAMATLGFERSSSGSGHRRKGGTSADLVELARALGVNEDPVVRQELADVYVRTQLHAAVVAKVARANASGDKPGPAGSLGKLIASDNLVRIGNAAADMLGSALVADTGEWGQFAWSDHVLGAPGYRLAGGTDEIQRNIIAERVLGLPAEHRADKAPFSQLSKN